MGTRHSDGFAMGNARKRGKRATGGSKGWRERRTETPLYELRPGGDAWITWGMAGAKGEKRRSAVIGGGITLGIGGKLWGPQGL